MGFSIWVKQIAQCPHCQKSLPDLGGEELYYAQKTFFLDYFNDDHNRIKQMEEALEIVEKEGEHWSMFEGTGEEALGILKKIKHIIDPEEYGKITRALERPNTEMYASW